MRTRNTRLGSLGLAVLLMFCMFSSFAGIASAATVTVGAGSYTTTLPAGAVAPQGTIYKTANVTGAMPTNDWWSSVAWEQYSDVMFPHPLAVVAGAKGLGVSYPVQSGSADAMFGAYVNDFTLGSTATSNFPDTKVDGFSDWTVSMLWNNGAGATMRVTTGHGLPYIYSTYAGGTPVLTFNSVPTVWSGSASSAVLGITVNGHHYALFGPTGSTWSGIGSTTLTNSLAGKNYFSIALLPDNSAATLAAYQTYGYSFVTGTQSSFAYDASASKVNTTYSVTTQAMEGTQTGTIMALYPAQWKNTAQPFLSYTYDSIRGQMKTVAGSSFTTSLTYQGILPALPAVGSYDTATLTTLVDAVKNEANHTIGATDTYWLGKFLGRIANLLPIAQQVGNTSAASNFESYLENTLSNNFVSTGKSNNLFYYDANWGTLIGYPASYGSDSSLNDHHFHYGYWIRAAAEVARNNPTWASQANWGGMVNLLVKDIANWDRTDTRFPYLRNFDPYEGHSWASGDAKFADGNNNESSSEGINAWSGLILWGQATGNTTIRDLGIYLYTTETNAVNEYWFNINNTNFKAGYNHNYSSMIWGGKSVYATWFSADPQQIRGINILPVTGASSYLAYNPTYSSSFINQLKSEFGGSNNWTSWPDILWEYQSLYDAAGAISLYNANPNYTPEDGESKAHTYSFIHNMNALGQVDTSVTANIPTYGVFKKGTVRTYVAYNAGTSAVTVTFSDGKTLSVPAGQIASTNGTGTGSTTPTISSLSPSSGTVGTSVTLSGTNFGSTQGTSTLKFGTVTATVSSWSNTSITASVPSGLAAGSYNVVATVNGVASNAQAFTVTTASTVSLISSVSPASGAAGASVTITGTNFGSTQGTSTVKFGTTVASVSSWSNTAIQATVPSGLASGSVNITVTNSSGTSNAASFTVTTAAGGDFTQSTTETSSSALKITFTPTSVSSQPIIHFQSSALYDGGQQNVYMTDAGNGSWTYTISPLSAGNQVTYSFTYTKDGTQQPETSTYTYTFGGSGGAVVVSTLYVNTGGLLSATEGTSASTNTIASAGGVNSDGTPTNATTYLISGLNGTYDATKATAFHLFIDAGTNIGDGVQTQVQYDFTGDGVWDRTETYNYFATNPVADWEDYTQSSGLKSSSGSFGNMANGKVRILVWNAIGSSSTTLRTNASSANGQQSVVTIPFK